MKLLALLLVTAPCAAMQKKATPMSKSAQKYATTKASCDKSQVEKSITRKPYTEEDKPWYLRIAEQKAEQYGQAKHGSRDHYLHEGADESKS